MGRPEWILQSGLTPTFKLGDYSVRLEYPQTKHPWAAFYKGKPMLRSHGKFTGVQRFMSEDNAKRWVERRQERPQRGGRLRRDD